MEMLVRFTLSAAGALVLACTATAQINMAQVKPIPSMVKDAGVYHLATGTWTRGASVAALAGPEVLYDNTCTTGYYWGMEEGDVMFDSGRIPSTSSPTNARSLTGLYDCYEIDGFKVGYCSFEPAGTGATVSFTDTYAACDGGGILPTPIAVFNLTNIPYGCWIIGFDLSNTTTVFNLGGDGDGAYSGTPSTDSFGWSWNQNTPIVWSGSGPLLTGDPLGFFASSASFPCTPGVGGGTTFVGGSNLAGSGIGSLDKMEIGNGPTNPGCYWFGGYSPANPMAAFFMQLQGGEGTSCGPHVLNTGTSFCFGDGAGAPCPCGNNGGPREGCANQTGAGATLMGSGHASLAFDTLRFAVAGMNGAKPGLLLRADNQINSGLGNAVGDGLLCIAGNSERSQIVVTHANGSATIADFDGAGFGAGSTLGVAKQFQWWYRDPMGSPCGTDFNLSNAWTVTYLP